mmetsp:Transcript_80661/g.207673  ORF Transcript_80661/g.207673 Transcript_80661/m.207673 type:complete len:204 (-) Transcript_80661:116-727(-)
MTGPMATQSNPLKTPSSATMAEPTLALRRAERYCRLALVAPCAGSPVAMAEPVLGLLFCAMPRLPEKGEKGHATSQPGDTLGLGGEPPGAGEVRDGLPQGSATCRRGGLHAPGRGEIHHLQELVKADPDVVVAVDRLHCDGGGILQSAAVEDLGQLVGRDLAIAIAVEEAEGRPAGALVNGLGAMDASSDELGVAHCEVAVQE